MFSQVTYFETGWQTRNYKKTVNSIEPKQLGGKAYGGYIYIYQEIFKFAKTFMDSRKFTGKEGQLISAEQALKITEPFQRREQEITLRGENYVKAEFFGIHTFNELISIHGDNCVGFRVYYGITEEEEENVVDKKSNVSGNVKRPTARLVLIPVDAYGNDLTTTARLGGMKDMPPKKEAMKGGPLCPSQC